MSATSVKVYTLTWSELMLIFLIYFPIFDLFLFFIGCPRYMSSWVDSWLDICFYGFLSVGFSKLIHYLGKVLFSFMNQFIHFLLSQVLHLFCINRVLLNVAFICLYRKIIFLVIYSNQVLFSSLRLPIQNFFILVIVIW